MEEAAAAQEFERAALHRDRLKAINSLFERQRVAGGSVGTADLIGVAAEGADANAQVFQVRDGILAERQSFYLDNQAERELAEVAEEFIGQYYSASPAMPRTVVVGPYLRERAAVHRRGAERATRLPRSRCGSPSAATSAACASWPSATPASPSTRTGCAASIVASAGSSRWPLLREALGMEELPIRIEGFDISNLGGEHTVASMVVFEGGATKKADYRRFRVRGEKRAAGSGGADDFASMEEVLSRRIARYLEQADLSPHDRSATRASPRCPR